MNQIAEIEDAMIIDAVVQVLLQDEIFAIVGSETDYDNLTPAQKAAFDPLEAEFRALFPAGDPASHYLELFDMLENLGAKAADLADWHNPVRAFYVVEDMETHTIQRGRTGIGGSMSDLMLRADAYYRMIRFFPNTFDIGETIFRSSPIGFASKIPAGFSLLGITVLDGDADGLIDEAEFTVGTNPAVADTDGDGTNDGQEVLNDTNPLDGLIVQTGVIAAVDTPGDSLDVSTFNNLAVTANADAGVTVFNIFEALNPRIVAQVDTPGNARGVAGSGTFIAVAAGPAGLSIIDISTPADAAVVHQVFFGFGVEAWGVAAAGSNAYVALGSGELAKVDLPSGAILQRLPVSPGQRLEDVFVNGDFAYVAIVGSIAAVDLRGDLMTLAGLASSAGSAGVQPTDRLRVFAGGGIAYAAHLDGYNTFDISNPAAPVLITETVTPQNYWKQIVPNGSGLGIAAVGASQAPGTPQDISLYDVSDPMVTDLFLAEFPTPGLAHAAALFNGLAYGADGAEGLQVINYLAYDDQGVSPTITISHGGTPGQSEEGQDFRVSAVVTDDVQVRNVQFLVDGAIIATDGNFPFEIVIRPPLLSDQPSFTIEARATDTGGNSALSALLTITLLPDTTAPRVIRVAPKSSAIVGSTTSVEAMFSEHIDPATLVPASFTLFNSGVDGIIGNGDDQLQPGGVISYNGFSRTAVLSFAAPLPAGRYRAVLSGTISDLPGNPLAGAPYSWRFRAYSFLDADLDGIPDGLETGLGFDPALTDTDSDGISDGLEDGDLDGVPTAIEFILGTDPTIPDTDADGVADGDEDADLDGLPNFREVVLDTEVLDADSDDDGWNDETEVVVGGDPLDPSVTPLLYVRDLARGALLSSNDAHWVGTTATVQLLSSESAAYVLGSPKGTLKIQ